MSDESPLPPASPKFVVWKNFGFPVGQIRLIQDNEKKMSVPLLDKQQARGLVTVLYINEDDEFFLQRKVAGSTLPESLSPEERRNRLTIFLEAFYSDASVFIDEILEEIDGAPFYALH